MRARFNGLRAAHGFFSAGRIPCGLSKKQQKAAKQQREELKREVLRALQAGPMDVNQLRGEVLKSRGLVSNSEKIRSALVESGSAVEYCEAVGTYRTVTKWRLIDQPVSQTK